MPCPVRLHRRVVPSMVPLLLAAGCQHYVADPPDPSRHLAEFLTRTPGTPTVRTAAGAFDPTDGLDAREAEAVALVFNRELRLARAAAGVTQATAATAGTWSDPELGVDLARILQSAPEPWKLFGSIGLTLPLSGRLELERAQAGRSHAATLARVAEQEWQLRPVVRRAFAEWEAAQARAESVREFAARLDSLAALVEQLERAGALRRAEARLIRIRQAEIAADVVTEEAEVARFAFRIRQELGLPPASELRFVPGARLALPDAEIDVAAALLRHPGQITALAEHQAAEAALELEIRRQYPDLGLAPGLGREDGDDQLTLGLRLPLPLWSMNRRAIAEATAQRDLARERVEAGLEQRCGALAEATARHDGALRRQAIVHERLMPLADEQLEETRRLAALGEVDTLLLLASLVSRHEAHRHALDAALAVATATVDLHELLGAASEIPQ